ncbi:hypothetical protein, partial [Kitasatospora nipponensis]|uniref:hypothetical protein n=1 Tax=Kitasatospora nipponensis TaxID=258049 RepID=UPI0031DA900D
MTTDAGTRLDRSAVTRAVRRPRPPVVPVAPAAPWYPLSSSQLAMWLLAQVEGSHAAYTVSAVY